MKILGDVSKANARGMRYFVYLGDRAYEWRAAEAYSNLKTALAQAKRLSRRRHQAVKVVDHQDRYRTVWSSYRGDRDAEIRRE